MLSVKLDSDHASSTQLNSSMCLRRWEQKRRHVKRETTQSTVIKFSSLSKKSYGEIMHFCQKLFRVFDFMRDNLYLNLNKTNMDLLHKNERRRPKRPYYKFEVSVSVYLYFMIDLT